MSLSNFPELHYHRVTSAFVDCDQNGYSAVLRFFPPALLTVCFFCLKFYEVKLLPNTFLDTQIKKKFPPHVIFMMAHANYH